MRVKTKATGLAPVANGGGGRGEPAAHDLELRPGGMLVQKRNPDSDRNSIPPPTIRVRVKYGSIYHEISISSQATFGKIFIFHNNNIITSNGPNEVTFELLWQGS